jgi:hypothetical protein
VLVRRLRSRVRSVVLRSAPPRPTTRRAQSEPGARSHLHARHRGASLPNMPRCMMCRAFAICERSRCGSDGDPECGASTRLLRRAIRRRGAIRWRSGRRRQAPCRCGGVRHACPHPRCSSAWRSRRAQATGSAARSLLLLGLSSAWFGFSRPRRRRATHGLRRPAACRGAATPHPLRRAWLVRSARRPA